MTLQPEALPMRLFLRPVIPCLKNYDVGNCELLAVVLKLQQWRHWLEGADYPFIVWKDHKNLPYLRTAHRVNSSQGWWALFLDRFNFTFTYRPGSGNKGMKPDAFSHRCAPEMEEPSEETVIPYSCVSCQVKDRAGGPGGSKGPSHS